MKHTIEMEWEQVDAIVVSELKKAHEGAIAELDFELAKAIEITLRHRRTSTPAMRAASRDANDIKPSTVNVYRNWEEDEIPF